MNLLKVTILWCSIFLINMSVWASEGVLDTTFHSPDGYVLWDGGSGYDLGRDIALQQDGKILVTGYMTNGTDNDLMVIRFNSDGTLDTGFGTNGAYIYDSGNGNDDGYAIAVQSDGKILLAGDSSNGSDGDVIVIRLDSDGSLDLNFGTNGIVLYDGGTREECYDLMVQSDDTILVAGHGGDSIGAISDWSLVVLKYDPNGAPDTTFGANGVYQFDPTDNTEWGYGLALQKDVRIVVAGQADNGTDDDVIVLRLTGSAGDSNEPVDSNDIPPLMWSQPPVEIDPNITQTSVFCGYGLPDREFSPVWTKPGL